jgi:hypothetical protein
MVLVTKSDQCDIFLGEKERGPLAGAPALNKSSGVNVRWI